MSLVCKCERAGGSRISRRSIIEKTLPNWPRLLNADEAASYVGVSKTTFLKGVGTLWPLSIHYGRRKLYDRKELDKHVDQLSGVGDVSDPLMEALN